jgi:hypothetical protein
VAELRIQQGAQVARQAAGVGPDAHGGGAPHEQPRRERPAPDGAAPELARALSEDGRALEARYELDAAGEPRIRIVDGARGETVAVLTPEELRALAEQTGLPPGLLLRTSS